MKEIYTDPVRDIKALVRTGNVEAVDCLVNIFGVGWVDLIARESIMRKQLSLLKYCVKLGYKVRPTDVYYLTIIPCNDNDASFHNMTDYITTSKYRHI